MTDSLYRRLSGMVVAMIAATLLVYLAQDTVKAYVTFRAPDGMPYSWNLSGLPNGTVYWEVSPDAPGMARDAMLAAATAWSDATGGALHFAEGPGGIVVDWDPTGTKVPDSLFLAYTNFSVWDSRILSASIVVNASSYSWQRNGIRGVGPLASGTRQADLDAVLLHEFGHALGLDHTDRCPSAIVGATGINDMPTMYSVICPGAETLHDDDEAGIRSLYGGSAAPVPTLAVFASPAKGFAPLTVFLDQAGGDADTAWDFGNGTQAKGTQARHRFTAPGIYTVTASSQGKSGTVTVEVEKKGKAKKPKPPRRTPRQR